MHQRIPTERLVDWPNGEGLTTRDATQRLADFGPNQVVPSMRVGWKTTMADTLRDPMLWFLLIIAALFAVVGNWMEAMVLVVALVPLFGMDLYLHRRTHASTQSLMSRLAETSVVLRDGQKTTLSSDEIVPGDCVWVTNGGFFPADGFLIEGRDGSSFGKVRMCCKSQPVPCSDKTINGKCSSLSKGLPPSDP